MDIAEKALQKHYEWRGKLDIRSKVPVTNREELSLCYTPGVAAPCLEIQKCPEKSFELTGRRNTVAVITDGTAVLGLGDIGPEAGMPVMEGKCALFKTFAGIDAIPLCLKTKDADEIVRAVYLMSGSFGGINLEDIAAPRCFEIERRLREICDIPVFHDDQHGTAAAVLAAVINALAVVGKNIAGIKIVITGAGAAGTAVADLLFAAGARHIGMFDKRGVLRPGRPDNNAVLEELSARLEYTNAETLSELMRNADLFIGVSAPGIVTAEMVGGMAQNPIVFALANPVPEIMPDIAKAAGAAVVGTGRSDSPNQINNALMFPGIFRGALDSRAKNITDEMLVAAAHSLAALITPTADRILPDLFDPRIVPAIARAVATRSSTI